MEGAIIARSCLAFCGNFRASFSFRYQWHSRSFRAYSMSGISAWNEDLTSETKQAIEKFWSEKLSGTHSFDDSKPKFYVLSMFPYPSGQLHMGHVRVYTISDVMARFYRMNGKNVIHPMGWDGFGLPAENAARENNIAPSEWTRNNIKRMKKQLLSLGCSFDWNREIATCDPEYYKWTQDIFLKMHSRGMVYQREALVNWDPVDETVLADEQVDREGRAWRSGTLVEKRWLKQWFIRTTRFAEALLNGLGDPHLIEWRDIIKLQQHWIGQCNGTTFDFGVVPAGVLGMRGDRWTLTVWTQRPECVLGASFIAIRPQSPFHLLCEQKGLLGEPKDDSGGTVTPWRTLRGMAHHPLTGEELPLIILNQNCSKGMSDEAGFLGTYGCRLGLPGENALDQKIAITEGFHIHPKVVDNEEGCMLPTAGPLLSGLSVAEARLVVCKRARALGIGGHQVGANLKDWLISRQRYWGTPIPMVHCGKCGAVPVPAEHLPVLLPERVAREGGANMVPTLHDDIGWKKIQCPRCGGLAERETDTMDTFVDSSWYFLRYLDPKNTSAPFLPERARKLMPVDLYIGGKEHAVLHLYYARFLSHFLHSEGLLPRPEPFERLLVQGMVMGKTYRAKKSGKYLRGDEVESSGKVVIEKATKEPVVVSWEKMSKSKRNGVEPSDVIAQHGTDTTRLLVLADVAPTSHRKWTAEIFPGIINWQRRLWITMQKFRELRSSGQMLPLGDHFDADEHRMWDSRNFYLKGATFNYSSTHQLSVAITKMQGLSNSLRTACPSVIQQGLQYERALAVLLMLLAPMAPHFATELWTGFVTAPGRVNPQSKEIDWESLVLEQKWPEVDYDYNLELIGKLNGAEFCRIKMPRKELDTLSDEEALGICLRERPPGSGRAGRVVTFKYAHHPGYQASVNILTEAGVSPKDETVVIGSKA